MIRFIYKTIIGVILILVCFSCTKKETVSPWTVYDQMWDSRAITVDSENNKWFGTINGILKYNGQEWTPYETRDDYSSNGVGTAAVDAQGNIWFGTDFRGIFRYDGQQWTNYTPLNSGLIGSAVTCIGIDKEDNKWFGTSRTGVVMFDNNNWIRYTTNNSGLASDNVSDIAFDNEQNIWFATYQGICKYNGTTWKTYHADTSIFSIAVDTKGNLWAGTQLYGTLMFDGTTWVRYNSSNSGLAGAVWQIAVEANGDVWFVTTEGVVKYDGRTWTQYQVPHLDGYYPNPPSGIVECMAIDKMGNKWFGGWKGIIVKLEKGK